MIFQQKTTHWQNVIKYAKLDAKEWKDATKINEETLTGCSNTSSAKQHKWKRPDVGWLKCNVDGSIVNNNEAGYAE